MNKLSQIKRQIKKNKAWKAYRTKFTHPQMQLIFSKVALELNSEINLKFLLDQEMLLAQKEFSKEMFIETFNSLNDKVSFKCDWTIFANFIWFIYQTSSYEKDVKKGVKNIFNEENYLKINEEKRTVYHEWLNSIDKNQKNFNAHVIEISRMVF